MRAGLRKLSGTRKPGLRALMDVARVDPSGVDEGAIGFRLGPRLNAAGRLYRADAGLELLLTADPERARAIADGARRDQLRAPRRRDAHPLRGRGAAGRAEQPRRRGASCWRPRAGIPGVIGIVAARIAERHYRPTVLIALDGDEGSGSGRSIPGFDLLAGLEAGADELLRHGGHRAAAGLTIARNRVERFREAFVAHAARTLTPADLVATERVDAVAPGDTLRLELAEELERLKPFGSGNPAVSLLVPAALLADPRPMGEGRHVAFSLAAGGARSRCVAFGAGSRLPAPPGEPVDAAVRLEANRYNGTTEPRLILRCAQPAAAEADRRDRRARRWRDGRARGARPRPHRGAGGETRPGELAADGRSPGAAPGRGLDDRRPCHATRTAARSKASASPDSSATSSPPASRCSSSPPTRRTARGRCSGRVGGFAVTSWAALEDDPGLAGGVPARRRAGPARARPPARARRTSAWSGLDPPGLGRR